MREKIERFGSGAAAKPDGWRLWGELSATTYPGADAAIYSATLTKSLPIRIMATGKLRAGPHGLLARRVEITFLGDGEPDVVTRGWFREW